MAKIVMIGAGSVHFNRNFITDVLLNPGLRDNTLSLVDINPERLDVMASFGRKAVEQNGFKTRIESTTDRREALEGANYVINTIRVGGLPPSQNDRNILAKYGLDPDDTMGPGGVFHGLRQIPAELDICRDMEKLCPDAWFMNVTNPQDMISWAINDYTHVKNVGLCPDPELDAVRLARSAGVPFDGVSYSVAGINHLSWYLEFKRNGEDLYPRLREKFKGDVFSLSDPDWTIQTYDHHIGENLVAIELFKKFGVFPNGSGGHISQYLPYFKRRPELTEKFKLKESESVFDHNVKRDKGQDEELRQQLRSNYKFPITTEYRWAITPANIIHSMETGTPRRMNCNVKNTGLITNLLNGCSVQVPCLVDKEGIHPCYVGELPPQCAALIQSNINVQGLAVKGIVEKNKNKLFQAILLDPLTSAVLSIDEIEKMTNELFQSNKEYLKGFK